MGVLVCVIWGSMVAQQTEVPKPGLLSRLWDKVGFHQYYVGPLPRPYWDVAPSSLLPPRSPESLVPAPDDPADAKATPDPAPSLASLSDQLEAVRKQKAEIEQQEAKLMDALRQQYEADKLRLEEERKRLEKVGVLTREVGAQKLNESLMVGAGSPWMVGIDTPAPQPPGGKADTKQPGKKTIEDMKGCEKTGGEPFPTTATDCSKDSKSATSGGLRTCPLHLPEWPPSSAASRSPTPRSEAVVIDELKSDYKADQARLEKKRKRLVAQGVLQEPAATPMLPEQDGFKIKGDVDFVFEVRVEPANTIPDRWAQEEDCLVLVDRMRAEPATPFTSFVFPVVEQDPCEGLEEERRRLEKLGVLPLPEEPAIHVSQWHPRPLTAE
jgi:hypothetical protein